MTQRKKSREWEYLNPQDFAPPDSVSDDEFYEGLYERGVSLEKIVDPEEKKNYRAWLEQRTQ